MAPAKRGTADPTATATATATAAASQRTIASFFGSKPASTASKTPRGIDKKSPAKTNESSDGSQDGDQAQAHPQPQGSPSKRARVGGIAKKKSKDERGSEPKSAPISPDSPRAERNAESKTKNSSDWLSTPSPSETGKPVTRVFGRRDRKAMKGGVVAPVLNSAADEVEPSIAGNAEKGSDPASLIGRRLKVYWPMDKVWYSGRVKSYDEKRGSHVIRYEDGEDESLKLNKEKVKWIEEEEAPAGKRTQGRSTGRNPPLLKRKIVEEENDADSLLDELKNGQDDDDVRSKTPTKGKRARVDEDSPAKMPAVSSDVYDEVDIAMPDEEQTVRVRKRLRKKVEEIEVVDLGGEEETEVGKPLKKRTAHLARKLELEEAADAGRDHLPVKSSHKSKVETLSAGSRKLDSDSNVLPAKDTESGAIKVDGSSERISTPASKKSLASDIFSRAKSTKNAAVDLPAPSVKPTSSIFKDEICRSPKDLDAEKRMRGELHSGLVGEHAERFGGRAEEKFKFLGKSRKDNCGRRPTDPDFDARTVLLPPDFLKGLSGGQRQWWEFKSKHMEKVLLFKMGKFYELFEMDAHVGAQELDLQYMKGEQPHCGFPEKLYSECAEKLARKGYRVLVVEQTETPDQLEQRKRETGAKDKVVKREVCAILTKGTIVDGEMLVSSPDAAYLMSITEMAPSSLSATPDNAATIGICFVDTSTSHIMLGQFVDDPARSRLRSVLSERRPVELIKPRGVLTEATERAIKDHTRQPLINTLVPSKEFWDSKQSLKQILEVYSSLKNPANSSGKAAKKEPTATVAEQLQILPKTLRQVVDAGNGGEAALSAIGGCLFYLREALLDRTLLRLGRIDLLQGCDALSGEGPLAVQSNQEEPNDRAPVEGREFESADDMQRARFEPYMILDSAALENLEILENNQDGGTSGTLLAHLDNCATPYGRRLLRQWLVRPLMRVESIMQRQQAVLDFQDVAAEAAMNFRKELKSQFDMERLLARLHACSGASGRNAENVVLYEDAAKKQLQEFMGALRGCRALLRAVESFQSCSSKLSSSRLRHLVTPGLGVPDMTPIIEHFETAFDREEAEKTGRIVPHEGVDEDFDEGDFAVKAASEKLAAYLVKQRQKFGNSAEIKYVTVGKEAYQMEIPEQFHSKVPSSYEMRSSRKGFQRYWTPEIKELLQDLTAGEQQRELALRGILQGLVKRFCADYAKWLALVKSVAGLSQLAYQRVLLSDITDGISCSAEVDVLISLSEASIHSSPTCRPTFVDMDCSSDDSCKGYSKIAAKDIRHPLVCTNLAGGGAFVPNDVSLGGAAPPFVLLTGPNMGGKSTLIRQVCLAVVLSQVGANVTAAQFELSPVDQVFVRMGAKDHIMAGQSTFLVELSETASMLRSASSHSLVALDELGRGTSTSDGQAIAHAVLQHLAHNVGCRGMFSTHYHRLATHFSADPKVGLRHMSCKVGVGADGLEEVLFLYKLAAGACPKSYGVNVARLAGMPESILRRASERATELESLWEKVAVNKDAEDSRDHAAEDNVDDSEAETKIATELVGLLKKIPASGSSDIGVTPLLQVWQEAKEMLQSSVNRAQ